MLNTLFSIATDVPDIPRTHTALAEWLFALVFIIFLPKRFKGWKLYALCVAALIIIIGFQLLAGMMPIALWIVNMIIAVLLMLIFIYMSTKINIFKAGYFVVIAFTIAEFAASLESQLYYFFSVSIGEWIEFVSLIILVIVYTIIFIVVFLLEKRYYKRNFKFEVGSNDLLSVVLIGITVFSISNLSFINIHTPFTGTYPAEILYIRTLVDLAGIILLYSQREHKMAVLSNLEINTMESLLDKQYIQYQSSIKNSELVNQRYHDLKHQIHIIRSETDLIKKEEHLNELEKSIKPYEIQYQTGNSVLDTLLSQVSSTILQYHINFTCVADGKQLNFISTMDLVSIFGNAMDNAIEGVKQLKDIEKRLVKLVVYKQNSLLLIKFENYYESKLEIQNGQFLTTKKDKFSHGYGIKSIRNTVNNYDGTLSIKTEDNWFKLMILIPINKSE